MTDPADVVTPEQTDDANIEAAVTDKHQSELKTRLAGYAKRCSPRRCAGSSGTAERCLIRTAAPGGHVGSPPLSMIALARTFSRSTISV
jgi:hypothetical protein